MRSVFLRCPECGTVNPRINNFCGNCGLPLVDAGAESVIATPELPVAAMLEEKPSPSSRTITSEPAPPQPTVIIPPAPVEPPRLASATSVRTPETAREFAVASEEPKPRALNQTTISGPSFLGLTDDSQFDQSAYLLEEERSSRRGGWLLFATVAIIVFAAIGWVEWNTFKTGRLSIPFIHSAASDPQPKSSPTATPNAATQPANPDANSNDAASDSDGRFTTTEPGDQSKPSASQSAPAASPAPPPAANNSPDNGEASDQDAKPKSAEPPNAGTSQTSDKPAADGKPEVKPEAARETVAESAPDPHNNKMLMLGEKYLYGRGVPKNCNQAMIYFRAAADEANAPAMSHLGAMYASGSCVTMNRATAYQWFARAENADPKNEWLARNLDMLWRDMTPKERATINR